MFGLVVKIDETELPRCDNIYYLGGKAYGDLPRYVAGWDVALMPFAKNESTRFISPTKTPEYLAAVKPVISTSIRDVVRPYGELNLVKIADSPADFVRCAEKILAKSHQPTDWLTRVDDFLEDISWDKTWQQMSGLMDQAVEARRRENSTSLPI